MSSGLRQQPRTGQGGGPASPRSLLTTSCMSAWRVRARSSAPSSPAAPQSFSCSRLQLSSGSPLMMSSLAVLKPGVAQTSRSTRSASTSLSRQESWTSTNIFDRPWQGVRVGQLLQRSDRILIRRAYSDEQLRWVVEHLMLLATQSVNQLLPEAGVPRLQRQDCLQGMIPHCPADEVAIFGSGGQRPKQ
eukprot:scaffold29_cov251-Pinguiococcus_pyrenoidosus.AAC.3